MGSMEHSASALPPDAFTTPFFSYDTSYIRHDQGTIRQDQYDEPHHDNHPSVSLASTPMSCFKDDEDFVRSGGKYHRCRFLFLWRVVYGCISRYDLTLQVWLGLLEGGVHDDVWLWVDGDEEKVKTWGIELKPSDWDKALSALSRRLKRTEKEEPVHLEERRRRVQEADLNTRMSMIAWLVTTSEAARATDASRGFRRREIWDLYRLIRDWYLSCVYSHDLTPNDSNAFQAFCDVMTTHGHTCRDHRTDTLKAWIWMRSILNPSQSYDVVYFSLREISSCPPCAAQARLLNRSSASNSYLNDSDVQYHPPHHLVFLWILWKATGGFELSEWLECLDEMACQKSSPLLKISTLKFVDSWLDTLPFEGSDDRFVPWVNFYPQPWRWKVTDLTSHDWELAETSIQAATGMHRDIHDFASSMDIRTWIGAVLLPMKTMDDAMKPDPFVNVEGFMKILDNYEIVLSIPALPEVQPTTAVINMRHALQESCHTCYKKYSPASLDWYASVVALTNGTEYTKFMPFNGDNSCVPCRALKSFRDLVSNETLSSSTNRQLNLDQFLQELAKIAAREGLRLNLPQDNSWSEGSSSLTERNPVIIPNRRSDMGTSDISHSSSRTTSGSHNQKPSSHIESNSKSETIRNTGGEPKTSRMPKGSMIKEIKLHFIKLLEGLGVPISGINTKQLPWTKLRILLAERGWELDNWPAGVPLPGSGDQSCDDNKGINGLDMEHLRLLYDAMKSEAYPLGFRKIVDAATSAATSGSYRSTSADEDRGSTDSNQAIHTRDFNSSHKRLRDDHNGDAETQPEKRRRT